MEVLDFLFTVIGSAINGVMQVFTDFMNLVIDTLPNPDPFPEIIAGMDDATVIDKGFVLYWLDQFIGVSNAEMLLTTLTVLWIASLAFAVVYKITGFFKI